MRTAFGAIVTFALMQAVAVAAAPRGEVHFTTSATSASNLTSTKAWRSYTIFNGAKRRARSSVPLDEIPAAPSAIGAKPWL